MHYVVTLCVVTAVHFNDQLVGAKRQVVGYEVKSCVFKRHTFFARPVQVFAAHYAGTGASQHEVTPSSTLTAASSQVGHTAHRHAEVQTTFPLVTKRKRDAIDDLCDRLPLQQGIEACIVNTHDAPNRCKVLRRLSDRARDALQGNVSAKDTTEKMVQFIAACAQAESESMSSNYDVTMRSVHHGASHWSAIARHADAVANDASMWSAAALHNQVASALNAHSNINIIPTHKMPRVGTIMVNFNCICNQHEGFRRCEVAADSLPTSLGQTCDCCSGPWLAYAGHTIIGSKRVDRHHPVCPTYTWAENDLCCYAHNASNGKVDVYINLPGPHAKEASFSSGSKPVALPPNWTTYMSIKNGRYYSHRSKSGTRTSTYEPPATLLPAARAIHHTLQESLKGGTVWKHATEDMIADANHPRWKKVASHIPTDGDAATPAHQH